MLKRRTAVLISGNGSNLQALMDAARAKNYPAKIALVICNRPDAYGIQRAQAAGIPVTILNHKDYPNREAFDREMDAVLRAAKIELVCMAGFMRLLSPWFVAEWQGRLINIHPSLLPKFKGLEAIKQALDAGETETGCTIHFVSAEMDAGPILAQVHVPIHADDTLETLTERVHAAEHRLYPETVKMLVNQGSGFRGVE